MEIDDNIKILQSKGLNPFWHVHTNHWVCKMDSFNCSDYVVGRTSKELLEFIKSRFKNKF